MASAVPPPSSSSSSRSAASASGGVGVGVCGFLEAYFGECRAQAVHPNQLVATLFSQAAARGIELTMLNLAGRQLEPRDLGPIIAALATPSHLQTLDFEHNLLDRQGCKLLADVLRTNTSVVSVDLSHNKIGDAGCTALAGVLAPGGNTTLRRLVLDANGIADAGVSALCRVLTPDATHALVELSLLANPAISPSGVAELRAAATACAHIRMRIPGRESGGKRRAAGPTGTPARTPARTPGVDAAMTAAPRTTLGFDRADGPPGGGGGGGGTTSANALGGAPDFARLAQLRDVSGSIQEGLNRLQGLPGAGGGGGGGGPATVADELRRLRLENLQLANANKALRIEMQHFKNNQRREVEKARQESSDEDRYLRRTVAACRARIHELEKTHVEDQKTCVELRHETDRLRYKQTTGMREAKAHLTARLQESQDQMQHEYDRLCHEYAAWEQKHQQEFYELYEDYNNALHEIRKLRARLDQLEDDNVGLTKDNVALQGLRGTGAAAAAAAGDGSGSGSPGGAEPPAGKWETSPARA